MGHPCAHDFRSQVIPLSVSDFGRHWWLVQPTQMHVEDVQVEIHMGLKRISQEYDNAPKHRKLVLLDHALADTGIRNPTKSQTRGRPTGSTQRLLSQVEHVAATLEAPVRRRQCRNCQQTGHNARTCRRQASTRISYSNTSSNNSRFRSTRL